MNCFTFILGLPSVAPCTPHGGHHKKKADLPVTYPSRHDRRARDPRPLTSALHTRTCPFCPTTHIFDQHAQRTCTSFNPQHWLLCHMGLYKFKFKFKILALRTKKKMKTKYTLKLFKSNGWKTLKLKHTLPYRTRTRTNTNPYDTKANAAG